MDPLLVPRRFCLSWHGFALPVVLLLLCAASTSATPGSIPARDLGEQVEGDPAPTGQAGEGDRETWLMGADTRTLESLIWDEIRSRFPSAEIRVEEGDGGRVGAESRGRPIRVFVEAITHEPLDPESLRGLAAALQTMTADLLADQTPPLSLDLGSLFFVSTDANGPDARPPMPPGPPQRRWHSNHHEKPRLRPIYGDVIDFPNADTLPTTGLQFDMELNARPTPEGIHDGVAEAATVGVDANLRYGLYPGVEIALGGGVLAQDAKPTVGSALEAEAVSIPVPAMGLKVQFPYELFGGRVAVGTRVGLVDREGRNRMDPMDHNRFTPFYLMYSRHLGTLWIGHFGFRRSRILSSDFNRGTSLTSFGFMLERRLNRDCRLQLEIVRETFGSRTVGRLGMTRNLDGPIVNAAYLWRFGPHLALQIAGNRLGTLERAEVVGALRWRLW